MDLVPARVGAALALLLGAFGSTSHAQEAAQTYYSKRPEFRLPVQMSAEDRAELSELKLYYRTPQGKWSLQQSAPPSQTNFTFRAPNDGEYWFTFVTVDRGGVASPTDLDSQEPGARVVIDLSRPAPTAVTQAKQEPSPILTVSNPPGNTPTNENPFPMIDPMTPQLQPVPDAPLELPRPITSTAPTPMLVEVSSPMMTPAPIYVPPPILHQEPALLVVPTPMPITQMPTQVPMVIPTPMVSAPAVTAPMPIPQPVLTPSEEVIANTPAPAAVNSEIQILNSTRFSLDYAVDEVRPGSPARVEFWATRDRGRNWERIGEDVDRRSPAELNLPGDGYYGIALRVTTGNANQPNIGDTPDFWVEVDTTKPVASLLPPTVGQGADTGSMLILWTASDRRLQPEPISLSYAVRPEGPWMPIAKALRNDGVYRWMMPPMVGTQVFLRMEVMDQAGNVTRVDSRGPIALDTKPKVRVLGVTPARMPGLE